MTSPVPLGPSLLAKCSTISHWRAMSPPRCRPLPLGDLVVSVRLKMFWHDLTQASFFSRFTANPDDWLQDYSGPTVSRRDFLDSDSFGIFSAAQMLIFPFLLQCSTIGEKSPFSFHYVHDLTSGHTPGTKCQHEDHFGMTPWWTCITGTSGLSGLFVSLLTKVQRWDLP